ncbi:tRNA (guanine(9)-N1)-methyltransferase [Micractinium conductrix]|uniref:tRNA (guanine(9)-N(1))-methyltransferase n=1 Tax=Micractinium conductrix TaxID=554055 RepID=A0A2P6V4J2_9CHLO|nr:tRNA (guanine(9)-N1)-methyltransferase [Micractinium conductrix]|eukprot:PSC68994.1 tRNA (guanine(9)-N1)-methyltransferase [Micractinium conductrix]
MSQPEAPQAPAPAADEPEAVGEAPQDDGVPAGELQADGETLAISKSQMKKLKKRQFYEDRKRHRKEAEKARKQADLERRREEGRQRFESMTEEEQAAWREERNARSAARKQERQEMKARMEKAVAEGQKVIIDLDFADLMRETEQKSICGQLAYSWHANCRAQRPLHLVLSGVQGKMKEILDKQVSGYRNWQATVTEQPYVQHFAEQKEKLVYLTADSDNELEELDPEAIYIIGGIVDRNRHKLLCYNKAVEQGISHARLPIGDYMKLASSQVMTTNHVVEIILRWLELKDWKQAFEAVIPTRKRKHEEDEGSDDAGTAGEAGDEGGEPAAEQQAAAASSGQAAEQLEREREQREQRPDGGEEQLAAAAAD